MRARTDKFRPSVIDPTKFTFIGHHYIGGMSDETWAALCDEINEGAEALEAHQKAHPGFTVAGHKWEGQCDCCGARYKFGAWFHTEEGNTYISIGGTCASKLSLGSPEAMKRFREQVNTFKVHQERVAKARAYLTTVNLLAMLDLYLDKTNTVREFPENTLRDMCGKVVQWGNELSEKQRAFAAKLLQQIQDRPKLEAEREARDANRKPIPVTDKRMTIIGKVISAKYDQGGWKDENGRQRDFYRPECIKITIEHADGWRVWGTCPDTIYGPVGYPDRTEDGGLTGKYRSMDDAAADLKGKTVQLDARVTISDKDPKFGFYKRPTKGSIITDTAVAA
jgi:hypothetical protein